MTTEHDARHEQALLDGAAEHGSLPAALSATRLEDCAGCRRFVRELAQVGSRLEGAANRQRALEAAAEGAAPSPGEARAWAAITGGTAAHRARVPFGAWWIAAAAVLAASCLFVGIHLLRGQPATPILGGPTELELVRPEGAVETYPPFVWRARLPAHGWYKVRVEGRNADGSHFRLESAHLTEARWDPPDPGAQGWPEGLRWEVEVHDASGSIVDVDFASARRKRP